MNKLHFDSLLPYAIPGKKIVGIQNKNEYEKHISPEYLNLLMRFNGGIFFKNGIKMKLKNTIPFFSSGYLDFIFLYGHTKDTNGINHIINTQPTRMPITYIPIAECDGGNFLCLKKDSGEIFFWWHEAPYDSECFYKITDSIEDFINNLEPDQPEEHHTNKDIFDGTLTSFKERLSKLK
ncbi:hypothetical protein A6V27_17605 [Hafnia alvei]|uniref:SMI1/KNR4 family protein n=1 Tax=Hafnia alvei TaxID=569 RepID=UPI0007BC9736|nr:SMI1/KNR4 family protein [Hafnia alvei]ANC42056.1 hypothetical protein A6V27_17605 [Hafnia alvei]